MGLCWAVEGALGGFGDVRRAAVGTRLVERVMDTGSLVIRKLGCDRAGEIAIHRFLSAPSVTCGEMVAPLATRTAAACTGRRIVAAQDTTEINFAGCEERRRGLGPAGDGLSAGFFIHPVIAIVSETEAVLGLLDARIWTRTDEFVARAPACCTAPECRRSRPTSRLRSGGTDVARASKLRHAVERLDRDVQLGRPTLVRA